METKIDKAVLRMPAKSVAHLWETMKKITFLSFFCGCPFSEIQNHIAGSNENRWRLNFTRIWLARVHFFGGM